MAPSSGRSTSRLIPAILLVAGQGASLALAAESERIAEVLALRAGMRVADVGAGDGRWTEHLARKVGETGHVYATEIDTAELRKIEERAGREGLDNVTTLLGTEASTGLPEGCCEAILLRLVYHHFTEPSQMRASLWGALRPGARLAVIDIDPQRGWRRLSGVPDRGGHGIREEELVREMTADGFEIVARYEDWNGDGERYCVVFRRGTDLPGDSAAPVAVRAPPAASPE